MQNVTCIFCFDEGRTNHLLARTYLTCYLDLCVISIYGDPTGFSVPKTPCFTSLGLKSKGSLPDSKITASSQWDSNHSPARARLDTVRSGGKTGAWSAKSNDQGQWIQADLAKVHKITGVVTQGRQDYNQWVKRYELQYSNDGVQFKFYGSLQGNSDRNTKVGHILKSPLTARYIRIRPTNWYGHVSMRFDLYGCTEGNALNKKGASVLATL